MPGQFSPCLGGLPYCSLFRLFFLFGLWLFTTFFFIGLFALYRVVYLSAMDRYILRSRYTQTNFITTNINDDNLYIVADHY